MTTNLTGEAYFWKKKEYASYLLSLLVFLIHISSFAQYADTRSFISAINQKTAFFFKEAITRFAVPMFFILSGIAFFKGYESKKYLSKLKSRLFSLVIPYLLWNTLWMIFEILCSYTFIANYFVGRVPFVLSPLNVLRGIFLHACNGPFWFVFDLIIFSLAAPLIYLVIRNKYVGIGAIVVLIVASKFGIHLPPTPFYSINSIIFYLIGALIGKHYFEFAVKKSSMPVQWISLVVFLVYITLKTIFIDTVAPERAVVDVIVFGLCSWAVWNMLDLFIEKINPSPLHSRSFAIFAMHINVSAVITKLIYLCLPKSEWFAIPNFIATFVLTLAVINLFCTLLERFAPRLSALMMGNRTKRKKT